MSSDALPGLACGTLDTLQAAGAGRTGGPSRTGHIALRKATALRRHAASKCIRGQQVTARGDACRGGGREGLERALPGGCKMQQPSAWSGHFGAAVSVPSLRMHRSLVPTLQAPDQRRSLLRVTERMQKSAKFSRWYQSLLVSASVPAQPVSRKRADSTKLCAGIIADQRDVTAEQATLPALVVIRSREHSRSG